MDMTKFSARKELAWMWSGMNWLQRFGFVLIFPVSAYGFYWGLPIAFDELIRPWLNLLR